MVYSEFIEEEASSEDFFAGPGKYQRSRQLGKVSRTLSNLKTLNIKKEPLLTILILSSDEILYQAALHPEIYTNSLTKAQISRLYKSLVDVTSLAVETLADETKFPESWLFKHRWNKGKKEVPSALPKGGMVSYLTVGGRTTAIVASVQKKTDGRKEEWVENGKSEKEDEVEGEEAVDLEEERAKRKNRSEGKKKKNQKAEALSPEPTIAIAEAKHHTSERPKRKTKLPVGAKQDEEESQPDDMTKTAAAEIKKAKNSTKKSKRKTKPAPYVEQEDESESQPASKPTQNTPTPLTKTAKQPKKNPPTGTKQEENEELHPLAKPPTRKSTLKFDPLVPATPTAPPPPSISFSQTPPNPRKKKMNDTNNSHAAAHVVYPSSSNTQKRKLNPSTEEAEEEEGDLPESSNNTTEKVSKKIRTTTIRTSRSQLQGNVEQVGSSSSCIDEDIWEGRRRSRRVSGRGVSPVVGGKVN